jgi:beta-lactamase superfamily II metal-dependent hydrolase
VLLGAFAIFTLPFLFKPSFAVYPLSLKGEDGFLVCYENSAIYITSPTDLKSEDTDLYAIQNAFKNHGINKIDLMLFDSPFKDRESSSAKLISTIPVKYVVLLKGNSDLENAFFDVNKEKTDIHIVGHDAQINFRGVKIRLIGENAVMLTANGKKYLFIGRRTHSLDSVLYADVVYARSGTKITGNMEFGKLYSY